MTPTILTHYGLFLYGADWKSALARNLGVARSTIQRWSTGRVPIPDASATAITLLYQAKLIRQEILSPSYHGAHSQDEDTIT